MIGGNRERTFAVLPFLPTCAFMEFMQDAFAMPQASGFSTVLQSQVRGELTNALIRTRELPLYWLPSLADAHSSTVQRSPVSLPTEPENTSRSARKWAHGSTSMPAIMHHSPVKHRSCPPANSRMHLLWSTWFPQSPTFGLYVLSVLVFRAQEPMACRYVSSPSGEVRP